MASSEIVDFTLSLLLVGNMTWYIPGLSASQAARGYLWELVQALCSKNA